MTIFQSSLLFDQVDLDAASGEGVGGFIFVGEIGQRGADQHDGQHADDQCDCGEFLFHGFVLLFRFVLCEFFANEIKGCWW